MAKQSKFRIAVVATKTYPNGGKSTRTAMGTCFAEDEADVLAQAREAGYFDNPENLPIEHKIEEFSFWFECDTKEVKNLRWWEEQAQEAAELYCDDHDDARSLEDLARWIEDSWSETVQRDGEPGPQPGHVDFSVNDDETKLIIRSTRILAVVTIKTPGQDES